jgi:hypothetical protein
MADTTDASTAADPGPPTHPARPVGDDQTKARPDRPEDAVDPTLEPSDRPPPAQLAELLHDVPRFDAATVLAGNEPGWFDLLERARATGPDPAFASLDDTTLVIELGNRAAHIAASMCAYLELVAELTLRGVWADQGATTPCQWLSYQLGLGGSTAADHLRVGLRLRELPAIRERFAAGRISYSKVRAITRIAVPETEELLLRWSQWATGAEVERIISAFRSTCGAGEATSAPDRDRSYRSRRNGDGTTTITIRLPDDEAAAVEANLDRLIDLGDPQSDPAGRGPTEPPSSAEDAPTHPARRPEPSSAEDDGEWLPDPSDEGEVVSPSDDEASPAWASGGNWLFSGDPLPEQPVSALGLDGLLRLDAADAGALLSFGGATSQAAPEIDHGPVPLLPRQRTRSARRVDAFVDACAAAAAGTGADTSGMDRHTLVLRAELADLQAPGPDEPSGRRVTVESPTGRLRTMDRTVLRRLACDANLVLLATDGRLPIDLGRQQRRPSAAQRRALMFRDRSCRFPGCDAHRHLHAHHVVHWADDGPTDLANLVLVCGFHHRFVHEHGWTVTPAATGTFRFAPPGGRALAPASQLPGDQDSPDPTAATFRPDAKGWALSPTDHHHPNLDLDMAIQVLHQEFLAILPLTDERFDVAS